MHIERIEIANKVSPFHAFVITEPTIRFYMISQLLDPLQNLEYIADIQSVG